MTGSRTLKEEIDNDIIQIGYLAICCLLGLTEGELNLKMNYEKLKDTQNEIWMVISKRGISQSLVNFILKCLQGNSRAVDLLQADVFRLPKSDICLLGTIYQNNVLFADLAKVSNQWALKTDNEYCQELLVKITELVEIILNKASSWFKESNLSLINETIFLNETSLAIQEIAGDLNLSPDKVVKPFLKIVSQLSKLNTLKSRLGLQ